MTLIQKIKLLFKVRKPAEELIQKGREIKRGWNKASFWISFFGTLASVGGALTGIIPPEASLLINTVLTCIYNILRGLDKADETGVRPVLRSTEFWQGANGAVGNAVVALQTGGIDPRWLHTAELIITVVMSISQNLGAQQPKVDSKN